MGVCWRGLREEAFMYVKVKCVCGQGLKMHQRLLGQATQCPRCNGYRVYREGDVVKCYPDDPVAPEPDRPEQTLLTRPPEEHAPSSELEETTKR
jgi:hypothetical protein